MKAYLLSAVAAAFCVSIVGMLPQGRGIRRIVTLCGGLLLLLTLLRPLISLRFGDVGHYLGQFQLDPALLDGALAEQEKETARLITEQTREYILDKAAALGMELEAEVTLAALSERYQYPYHVTLTGGWTQDQRAELTAYIAQTLGIPEERQLWNESHS